MIDVMIITFNESLNLPHSLRALEGWTRKVFVIDSGSTDGTQDIARSFGAEPIHHDWPGYAAQKNWGLDTLPFESDWILIIDADEVITPEVKSRLLAIAEKPPDETAENGFYINRVTYFMDRPIKHCGYFPSWNLRFFKRGRARYEDRAVHEHMIIDDPVGYIKEAMIHDDRRGLEHYIAKHNRYSTLEGRAQFEQMTNPQPVEHSENINITAASRRRRWLKRNVMPYVPFAGLWRFMYMYVARGGILDGRAGFEFCRFIAMYDYMVSLKLREIRRQHRRVEQGLATEARPDSVAGLATAEGADSVATSSGQEERSADS